jgi:hypothetical protein
MLNLLNLNRRNNGANWANLVFPNTIGLSKMSIKGAPTILAPALGIVTVVRKSDPMALAPRAERMTLNSGFIWVAIPTGKFSDM